SCPELRELACSALSGRTRRSEAQTLQVNKCCRFEELFRRHRDGTSRCIASAEKRSNSVRQRPDVQRHHQSGRTLLTRWQRGDQHFARFAQNRESIICRLLDSRKVLEVEPGLEHCGEVRRLRAGKAKVGPT